MEVIRFGINKKDVERGVVEGEPFLRAANGCPCGCALHTFVSVSNGEVGLTVHFQNEEELQQFKQAVAVLEMPYAGNCRYCQHLVDKNRPREKWIGGCEFDLRPETCGKYEVLHKIR